MASLTASSYFSHPWFDKPSMKRRHSSSEDELPVISLSLSSPTNVKRRKVAALERGFSNLSLQHTQPVASTSSGYISPPSALPHSDSELTAMEVDYPSMTPSIQPDSVEEPLTPSPSVPEIRMKGFSWYEPEPDRIVVTDLDSSDDEEEKETEPAVVLPALLDRIRQREQDQSIPLPLLPDQQALVLYQPVKKLPEVEEEKERSVDMMDIE